MNINTTISILHTMFTNGVNDDWLLFCNGESINAKPNTDSIKQPEQNMKLVMDDPKNEIAPISGPLKISTKTTILRLSEPVELNRVFWNIPIVDYHSQCIGVVKKQMKFNSKSIEEVNEINENKSKYKYVDETIIRKNYTDITEKRNWLDVRKVSIGISCKDIIRHRTKKRGAFYNCFVLIVRMLHNKVFKEYNVKIFNTGKIEIPGICNDLILSDTIKYVLQIINDNQDKVYTCSGKSECVMINSDFNCGYYINRETICNIFRDKYKIKNEYDPCSYPGIQCTFYYDSSLETQTGIMPSTFHTNTDLNTVSKISFMIFRTGSVLIVGKATEKIIYDIYDFLCKVFTVEFNKIKSHNTKNNIKSQTKNQKICKKYITTTII